LFALGIIIGQNFRYAIHWNDKYSGYTFEKYSGECSAKLSLGERRWLGCEYELGGHPLSWRTAEIRHGEEVNQAVQI